MCICLFVCLSSVMICLSLHCPSVHPSIRPSFFTPIHCHIHKCVCQSEYLLICMCICLFVCLSSVSICLSLGCPFFHLSTRQSFFTPIHCHIHKCVCQSEYLLICMCMCLIACLSICLYMSVSSSDHPFIQTSIHLYTYLLINPSSY